MASVGRTVGRIGRQFEDDSGPHEPTYANIIHVIVNARSNFHLFGHVTLRSRHCYVAKC